MKIQVYDPIILDWYNYEVINLDTGQSLKYIVWADDETGEYECYVADLDGKTKFDFDEFGYLRETRRGNIKIQKKNP